MFKVSPVTGEIIVAKQLIADNEDNTHTIIIIAENTGTTQLQSRKTVIISGNTKKYKSSIFSNTLRHLIGNVCIVTFTFSFCNIYLVKDFNNNPPNWVQESFVASVSPDAEAGQMITAVTARDPDDSNQGKLLYHIQEGDEADSFQINEDTGDYLLKMENNCVYKLNTNKYGFLSQMLCK